MLHMLYMLTNNLIHIMPRTLSMLMFHMLIMHMHHAFLYGKVCTCTCCGRKGHLAKFCYDRINTSNDHI